MEIRDRQTLDAVTDVATILATAYQRYRRARRIEIVAKDASKGAVHLTSCRRSKRSPAAVAGATAPRCSRSTGLWRSDG